LTNKVVYNIKTTAKTAADKEGSCESTEAEAAHSLTFT